MLWTTTKIKHKGTHHCVADNIEINKTFAQRYKLNILYYAHVHLPLILHLENLAIPKSIYIFADETFYLSTATHCGPTGAFEVTVSLNKQIV
jgi:hypothetical protein